MAGVDRPEERHLFHGAVAGSPGSVMTCPVRAAGTPGREGLAPLAMIGLAVPSAS